MIDPRKYADHKTIGIMRVVKINKDEFVLSADRFSEETGIKIENEEYVISIAQLKKEIADLENSLANRKLMLADIEE
jgi:hypothetical protein